MTAALYWKPDKGGVRCLLCPHGCLIPEGEAGLCIARRNLGGVLVAESYGMITSLALDPIEKKPLYHYAPGSRILSAGSYGCNLSCGFCQNHHISAQAAPGRYISPQELADICSGSVNASIGVAFTYNEPLIAPEYMLDCARLLREREKSVVLVTNGFILPEPLEELLPYIDALNIDLKCFSREGYRKLGGELEAVKHTIRRAAEHGCHTEVTTLIVPGVSDNLGEMEELSSWLADISPDIPLHISRFFPRHHMSSLAPTPLDTVYNFVKTARGYLRSVYAGNC